MSDSSDGYYGIEGPEPDEKDNSSLESINYETVLPKGTMMMKQLSEGSSSDSAISESPPPRSVTFADDECYDEPGQTLSTAMRQGEFKQTSRRKSQWGQYLMNVDIKRVMASGTFRLTLLQLARDGESDTLDFLLKTLDVNQAKRMINATTDEEGATALHVAAKSNHFNICKQLIDAGANVNVRAGESRATPLHCAARVRPKRRTLASIAEEVIENNGDSVYHAISKPAFDSKRSIIILLHASGANINDADIEGQTALHCATLKGNHMCVQQLLACKGVDIELKDGQGMTALHLAATHGYKKIVDALLYKGANLDSVDNDMMTPLHFAAADGNVGVVRCIVARARERGGKVAVKEMLYRVDAGKNTALHIAVGKGHVAVVKELLAMLDNTDDVRQMVSMTRSHGDTPLHIAAAQGFLEICDKLIDSGAEVDARNDNLATPLLLAAHHNNFEIVEFLMDKGSDLETREKDNLTPLLLASKQGHIETISWLIDRGADCNASDKHDKTCLMLAVEEQRTSAVHELLKHESIIRLMDETDKNSNTVLHIAARKGYLPILKVLLDYGARIDAKNEDEATSLHIAAQFGQHIALKELLNHSKASINAVDENANTALHLASIEGHTKCVETLIEHGVNVALRNTKQMTPLDCACSKGWETTVLTLLKAQSAINPSKGSRTTPLHEASVHGHAPVVRLLLDWKADVSAKLSDGRNPLDCAIDQNQADCVQEILDHDTWRQALRNAYIDPITENVVTPTRKLIVKMPEMAQFAFSRAISDNRRKWDDKNLEVTLDFEFLDDMYTVTQWLHKGADPDAEKPSYRSFDKGSQQDVTFKGKHKRSDSSTMKKDLNLSVPEDPSSYEAFNSQGKLNGNAITYTDDTNMLRHNHPLMIMVSTKREGLLQHPVVTALLQYKWNKYGGFVYYSTLLFLMTFVVLLNCYMLLIPPPYTIDYLKSLANRRFYLEFTDEHLTNYSEPAYCYSLLESGTTYRGFVNKSLSNKTCLEWATTSTDKQLYPDSGLDKNYCRNPGASLDRPWCFTNYSEEQPEFIVREECDVQMCPVYVRNNALTRGTTCHFPFLYAGVEYTSCVQHSEGDWCSATANYDEDKKWGYCTEVDPYCLVPSQLKRPCGKPGIDRLNCEARGCCYEIHDKGLPTQWAECFQKFDECSDWNSYCEVNKGRYGCTGVWEDWMAAQCPLTCGLCNVTEEYYDTSRQRFLYLMSVYPEGSFDPGWMVGCYYCLPGAEKKWGTECRFKGSWDEPIKIILLCLCVFNLARLLLQVWNYRVEAFRPVFLLELLLYTLCMLLVIDLDGFDLEYTQHMYTEEERYEPLVEGFQKETGLRQNWQWQCGVTALFLSWMNLLLYIQKIPYLGIYVVMFNDIFKTFTKFSLVFLLFILSFAFTFHALLQNEIEFEFPFQSILKTTVMMVGELDFTGIFLGGSEEYAEKVNYLILTYVLFAIFIVVMMIIIMNLLVGLAVGDIMEVQQHATLERLKMQVELALEVEFAVPNLIRKRFVRKSANIKPNRYRGRNALTRAIFEDKNLSTKNLASVMSTGKSDSEELQDSMQQLLTIVKELKMKNADNEIMLKDLLAETKEMKSTVDETADVQQQKIAMEEEQALSNMPNLEGKKGLPSPVPMRSLVPAFMRSGSFRRSSGKKLRSSLRGRAASAFGNVVKQAIDRKGDKKLLLQMSDDSSEDGLYATVMDEDKPSEIQPPLQPTAPPPSSAQPIQQHGSYEEPLKTTPRPSAQQAEEPGYVLANPRLILPEFNDDDEYEA